MNIFWFGFEARAELSLSQYVHEGTDMLIFSILLAIVVVAAGNSSSLIDLT